MQIFSDSVDLKFPRKKRWTCSIRITVRLDSCRKEALGGHYTSLGAVDGNEPPRPGHSPGCAYLSFSLCGFSLTDCHELLFDMSLNVYLKGLPCHSPSIRRWMGGL